MLFKILGFILLVFISIIFIMCIYDLFTAEEIDEDNYYGRYL